MSLLGRKYTYFVAFIAKKERDGSMDHIESLRLFELAGIPTIIDQPEWKHIENCKTCGLVFVQFNSSSLILWNSM